MDYSPAGGVYEDLEPVEYYRYYKADDKYIYKSSCARGYHKRIFI